MVSNKWCLSNQMSGVALGSNPEDELGPISFLTHDELHPAL